MDRKPVEGLISTREFVGAFVLVLLVFFLGRQSSQDGANAGGFGSFFSGAKNFVINFITIYIQGDDSVAKGMKALSEHCMKGAAYDSSLRDPPPHCHPGTRVQLMEKIITWFRKNRQGKALFWLNGPAGVGKSAVIQTVAESLVRSNSVGATLFFSKLNNRNNAQRVFITVAFHLATRIPNYQKYITKQILLDPSLLEKGLSDQFRIFIAEPFGNQRMGRRKGPWAVLLDGLDECEGMAEQRRIVQLVSEFVLNFPDTPLMWVIASRREPHIVGTFNDEAVAPSFWSEYMPLDSTQACQDVELYLNACFTDMRKLFPHLPLDWPNESQFVKLAHGALGLFAFARTAVHYMEDPHHADPVSRLNLILFIIDRFDIRVIDDHPFALLDALYTQILASIPPSVWRNTKRILGFIICTQSGGTEDGFSYPLDPSNRTLMKISIVLGLELSVMYGSLHQLHSVLDIPGREDALHSEVKFRHASFGDYLVDQARSKDFYIDVGESVDVATDCLFQLFLNKPWDSDQGAQSSELPVAGSDIYLPLRKEALNNMRYVLTGELRSKRGRGPLNSPQDRSHYLDALGKINPVEVYRLRVFEKSGMCTLLLGLWSVFREELQGTGLFKQIPLRDLKMGHLNGRISETIFIDESPDTKLLVDIVRKVVSHSARKKTVELQQYQQLHPERLAMVYGGQPERRIAFFPGKDYSGNKGYFCFPYPY